MEFHESVASFRKALDTARTDGRTVGLVPTMGYIHEGHASLMRRAVSDCDVVA
ncbi:MAG: pantoate--beta-alanine ligase, partial [Acidimicrobiales bacterium]